MPYPVPARTIVGSLPTSSYAAATAPQLRGKAGNKTAQYMADMLPTDPGNQAFYAEALNDIPHPLEAGKVMNYGQVQQLLNGPQRAAALDAYAAQNKLPRVSAAQMQQAMFEAAKPRLMARGAANPGEYAFPPSADAARRAPSTATGIAHGNFAAADQASNAAVQAQRFADIAGANSVMAAPGMSVRLVRGPDTVPVARVIRGGTASR